MASLVNYSSEDDHEESPRRNVGDRYPVVKTTSSRDGKEDSSRRNKRETSRSRGSDRSQGSSYKEKDTAHSSFRKSSYKEESKHSRSIDHHYRDDRRSDRSYEKRDQKNDRKRSHRDRDRDYDHCDEDKDRRNRSDRYRREKHTSSSYRDKDRRKRTSESPNERNASSNRNRSVSISPSKDYALSHNNTMGASLSSDSSHRGKGKKTEETEEPHQSSTSQHKTSTGLQAVLSLPLKDPAPPMTVVSKTDGSTIALPTYYNPNIINPTKYADQVQKRKLIWGAKKAEDTAAKWGHATFSEDSDGKVASKFMRLMGIKSAPKVGDQPKDEPVPEKKGPDVKSRQAMFSNMEQQYEVARQVTHTMRGVGLGFGSQSRQY